MTFYTISDDDDRDVERRGRTYLTRRDVLIFVTIAAIVIVLAYLFVFRRWKADRDFAVSKSNLAELSQALSLYAEANNDGLPPVYLPGVSEAGRPYTWANQIFGYIGRMEVFDNGATPEDGKTYLMHFNAEGKPDLVALSYGMLSSADTARRYEIRDETILLAETVGSGAAGSYNPLPLGGPDGFMIGYDNSNGYPNATTRYVTRLGFIGEGAAPMGLMPIHPRGTVGIRADGSVVVFATAEEAFRVSKVGKKPAGHWSPY